MPNQPIPAFDRSTNDAYTWINLVAEDLGTDRQTAYHAFRGTFFAVRDRMTVDEAAHLAAQLPLVLRGVFYEGFRPADLPRNYRDDGPFLETIEKELATTTGGADLDAREAASAVLDVLHTQLPDESEQARAMMPEEVRAFWPEPEAVAA